MTLISVIIPSFRQPQFLARAIESCLEQDHDDLEVIVIDDRSRDSSLGIALAYSCGDPRVRVFEAFENGGLGKARNLGIARANGEYLCFLDSDDYLLPGSLSARLQAMPDAVATHGDKVAGVYGDWQHVGEAVDYVDPRRPRKNMGVVSAETYTGENVFICSAPLVLRERVMTAGGFPEGLPMLEDFALWARMIADGAIFVPTDHVVATYRQRQDSMLRGDGVVVMADYVDVINRHVQAKHGEFRDAGALGAWLADATPYSFGRMTWNLPSVLGNFGGGTGADAVSGLSAATAESLEYVDDFMSAPVTAGLAADARQLESSPPVGEISIRVTRPTQALEAMAIRERLARKGQVVTAVVESLEDWTTHWPLALGELRASTESDGSRLIDLDTVDHEFADVESLVSEGAEIVWGPVTSRTGGVVYVSDSLASYPALDAWISVAMRGLATAGYASRLMAEPKARAVLAGWRSDLVSLDELRNSEIVIHSQHVSALAQLAPLVVFNPLDVSRTGSKTAAELHDRLIRQP